MNVIKKYLAISVVFFVLIAAYFLFIRQAGKHKDFVSYELNPKQQELQLYWRDNEGKLFKNIGNLKKWLDTNGRRLLFAMNAGMFRPDYSPQGLFIQKGHTISPLDTAKGSGNFYLKPNGVFYITTGLKAVICRTEEFHNDETIAYAAQSGPLLITEGMIHPAFQPRSENRNIRNGVGILPNGNIVFAMSTKAINFYEIAGYFRKLGCKNALYLDGFVSRTYLPEKNWVQTSGDVGVIIGVTAKQ